MRLPRFELQFEFLEPYVASAVQAFPWGVVGLVGEGGGPEFGIKCGRWGIASPHL